MKVGTLARWKVKYQRATGYIALGTFIIVLYGLIRELHRSPFFPIQLEFWMFVLIFFGIAFAGIIILADLDWRYVFKNEQAQNVLKSPLLYTMMFQSAWLLVHHDGNTATLEENLKAVYRHIGVEDEFEGILRELKR